MYQSNTKFSLANFTCGVITLMVISLPTFSQSEDSDFQEVMIIEGSDLGAEEHMRATRRDDPGFKAQRKADRELVIKERHAMKKNGFIITDEIGADLHNAVVYNPYKEDVEKVIPLLGFDPSAFHLGYDISGVLYDVADDGRVHDITTILAHPELGLITVRERSIGSEPKPKRSKYIRGPKFDIKVNDNRALLRAYQTKGGEKARTALTVLNSSKLYTVSVGAVLIEGTPGYEEIFNIASKI